MVHATSVTTTTGVLSCTAHSALTHGHVTSHTSSLPQPCYLTYKRTEKCVRADFCRDGPHSLTIILCR